MQSSDPAIRFRAMSPVQLQLQSLIDQLDTIRSHAERLKQQFGEHLQQVHPHFADSAHNLIEYLALRQFDLREIQEQLSGLGLSSLGRTEAHTMASLNAVVQVLQRLAGRGGEVVSFADDYARGRDLLTAHTEALLGPRPATRATRIMVTLPSEAESDYPLLRNLIRAGMNCARINCAHDSEPVWERMVGNIRRAEREVGCACRILMDLGGPKLRTGPLAEVLTLRRGEGLVLCRGPEQGKSACENSPARVVCAVSEIYGGVQVGEAVLFDDGKIESVVRGVAPDEIQLEITRADDKGSRLAADKGINFPESRLELRGLSEQDLEHLDFVARRADLVGMSFANEPEDVFALQAALGERGAGHLGIVLKIETRRGFEQLPRLILAAMRSYPAGVMIARGDLAVECGWERTAEVQEEILWLCEAGHMPVIWATQVLEKLAKKGLPSRAEITDAAMSQRAECVMLNKGPHVVEAVHSLADILCRMQEHQRKKTATLRSLKVSNLA